MKDFVKLWIVAVKLK